MEELTGLISISLLLIGVYTLGKWSKNLPPPDRPDAKLSLYRYGRKKYIMTKPESDFFRRLEKIAGSKYYIFPQVHLSSLLDHEVRGQNWRGALAKIQRKSVDFVLVDRQTLITSYAIELDDRSHDISVSRTGRDEFVNEIFKDAGVALVRFRNTKGISDETIATRLQEASLQALS